MKAFLEKYQSLKYLIYFFIAYMIGFMILENQDFSHMIITDTWIDQYIPFNEYFVIPYVLWFVFMVLFILLIHLQMSVQVFMFIIVS